ncbi:MAG: penicillin-insensitive murein endopeptidase [Polyangiaceae bacterium]|nr:penicillin-insensitive murein endopeptidase [Polyangiaceae bacterium]
MEKAATPPQTCRPSRRPVRAGHLATFAAAVAFSGAATTTRAEPVEGSPKPELAVGSIPDSAAANPAQPTPAEPLVEPMQRLGSISVGHPNAGYLVNGVKMPPGDEWVLSIPDHAWGTDETIEALVHALRTVAARFPGGPRAILGSISAEHGGPLSPHKSHRTGRDADVHLFLTQRKPGSWYEAGTAANLDRPRCWAFLRTLLTETDVEMVLLDQSVQDLLEEYALLVGEDPAWIADVFDGTGDRFSDLIKHVPGHQGHFHIRFVSQYSRLRGRDLYDRLVEQGQIDPPVRELRHVVVPGDTLIGIGRRYGSTALAIQTQNGLNSSIIRAGQELLIAAPVDIPGARDPVIVPRRRLPPRSPVAQPSG